MKYITRYHGSRWEMNRTNICAALLLLGSVACSGGQPATGGASSGGATPTTGGIGQAGNGGAGGIAAPQACYESKNYTNGEYSYDQIVADYPDVRWGRSIELIRSDLRNQFRQDTSVNSYVWDLDETTIGECKFGAGRDDCYIVDAIVNAADYIVNITSMVQTDSETYFNTAPDDPLVDTCTRLHWTGNDADSQCVYGGVYCFDLVE